MIFKSLCPQKPLHLYFWNHKNVGHVMPAGAFGAVRPVGAILPTATAAGPSHSRSHGRLRRSEGPCRPAIFGRWIISVTDHANMALTKTKNAEWCSGKLRCHSTNGIAIARHVHTEQLSCLARRDKVFWFSTLLTTAIRRYLLIIRKLAD